MIRIRENETPLRFALRLAKDKGVTLDMDMLEYMIWELTGYPCFFTPRKGETTAGCFSRQLRVAMRRYADAL